MIRANEVMFKAGQTVTVILRKLSGADPEGKRHVVRLLRTFEYRQHLCLVFENMVRSASVPFIALKGSWSFLRPIRNNVQSSVQRGGHVLCLRTVLFTVLLKANLPWMHAYGCMLMVFYVVELKSVPPTT